ncbi:ECF sigma factor [Rubripirellula lacrimiformis]|uniref:ECF sigma factor n=1 Tax=Rubripirellula lacrimiformis TaxID=1930273 RepID=A0A517NIV5_9BACT|nr:sigma-70 family RNA polymerase sigma factor [Rubripirellula lacrimiformis]QDT07018.1 ECF sigma factor [Rubripirellula lacrimiformis]
MIDSNVNTLLSRIASGDAQASSDLLPLVYTELRRMAKRHLRNERASHTLDPTGLVHEAYLRMVGSDSTQWVDSGHFFAIASTAMRRILIEHARSKNRFKRGGNLVRVPLDPETLAGLGGFESDRLVHPEYVMALDEGLNRLQQVDPTAVEVIHLRYFAGLSIEQTAEALGISSRTVCRSWSFARAWLHREMFGDACDDAPAA